MASMSFLSFLCILFVLIPRSTSQPNLLYKKCLYAYGYYTNNSTYQSNLNALLPRLTSNTQIDYGFYNLSYGQGSDTANAMGLCRGDVKPEACRSCLNNSRVLLPLLCPDQKDSVGGYDECLLHYSDASAIFGMPLFRGFSIYLANETRARDWDGFNKELRNLLQRLGSRAAEGDSLRKFAAGHEELAAGSSSDRRIYAIVQCLPGLTGPECSNCLAGAAGEIPNCCEGKIGGRIIKPSCNFRYENYRFYDESVDDAVLPQASPPRPPPPPRSFPSLTSTNTTSPGKSKKSLMVMAIVVPIVAIVVLLIFVCIYLRLRKKRKLYFERAAEANHEMKSVDSLLFDFETIRAATNNFSDENKLGQGGFGPVYKGRLFDGREVAVKRLSKTSGQGDTEFKNEVLVMSKLQHRNLVRLLGFCLERTERLLVYEFLPNKSLDFFIFDPIKRAHLDWEKRYQIIDGITRGLLYLHEDSKQRIIHRDLKASNILLDAEMNPKISDFGTAKLFEVDQSQANTNKIVGTYGYMAPEYAVHGKFSVKSDVFSFGVLILEIVSGKKHSGFRNGEYVEHLLSFAWKNWRKGTSSNIVDNTLNDGSRYEMMRCIHIGLLCVQKSVAERPTIASIALMLSSNSLSLPIPLQPAFFMGNNSSSLSDTQSWEYSPRTRRSSEQNSNSIQVSVNDASITEPYPR